MAANVGLRATHRAVHLPLPHTRMARLAASGKHEEAQAAYEDLLTLWRDADADILILKQAKAE